MKSFSERTIVPRAKKTAVRTIGRNRELVTRLAASEAAERIEARRRGVYENPDAVYAPESRAVLPPIGPARDELVARLRELKGAGLSHAAAAEALEIEVFQVAMLCKKHGIKKGTPD